MHSRRRIDWSVLPGVDQDTAVFCDRPEPAELVSACSAFTELFEIEQAEAMLKRAVEFALRPVGLVRAGLYLYDEPTDLMLGSWGTGLDGSVVDEHHVMFKAGEHARSVFERALSGHAHWTVVEKCPIIDQRDRGTQVVGQGWVVCTPVVWHQQCLGMLYNDAGLTGAQVDPAKQLQAALLCSLLGAALRSTWASSREVPLPSGSARHPALKKAIEMLRRDPSLGGRHLAEELDISLSRLARLFRTELGVSLVDYRNQLRLERFMELVEGGSGNLLRSALAAGFGSYAQFHRVFRAVRGKTPRDYFTARGFHLSQHV